MSEKVDVLQFMLLRTPVAPTNLVARRTYIPDDQLSNQIRVDVPLFHTDSPSWVGRAVYQSVFCAPGAGDPTQLTALTEALVAELLDHAPHVDAACPNEPGLKDIQVLQGRTFIGVGDRYYLPPEHPEDLDTPYRDILLALEQVLSRAVRDARVQGALDAGALRQAVAEFVDLPHQVFDDGEHVAAFRDTRRVLFDTLYQLYILRRRHAVSLEPIVQGIAAMNILEALALDVMVETMPDDFYLGIALRQLYPELYRNGAADWQKNFPLIGGLDDLQAYMDARPVVHILFARLHRFRFPFNDIKPIGIGDLKVVKQWLRGYSIGDISHVDNVLIGETRSRVHRHLEKQEDVFTLTSDLEEEATSDTQTTDRFEMRRETENVIKSDLSAQAGLNVNLTSEGAGYHVVSTITGGVSYARSQTDQLKVASNFARDVVDRAVKRVQSKVSRTRTTTSVFETEETNTHAFDNKTGEKHISGLHRWLNKEYRSQLYNYGKRMMFEFVLPEPAAFLVESRLRAYESALETPRPPSVPHYLDLPDWLKNLTPTDVTPERFGELRRLYDLGDLEYPILNRSVEFVNSESGRNYFTERGIESARWQGRNYTCRLNAKSYRITNLLVRGYLHFWGRVGQGEGPDAPPNEINTFEVRVDGHQYVWEVNNDVERWYFGANFPADHLAVAAPTLADDSVSLFLGFWDIAEFDLSVHAQLEIAPAVLESWQTAVISRIKGVEQRRVDAVNAERRQSYLGLLGTYRNRLAELRSTAINDLLQGQSESWNRQLILRELKRQCISILSKEFDSNVADDRITGLDATATLDIQYGYRRLQVTELPSPDEPTEVDVSFATETKAFDLPVIKSFDAKVKGRFVQFLEQAFEWQQMSYLSYPYFWATPPKWIELLSRSDDADPFLTSFLQAGSVRVLLAVTPAHEDAVLHYIATGEPWEGGAAPAIGDPLYVPIYEELRRQQDDLAGAVPEGDPWDFTLPTSLVYLENSTTPLPPLAQ